MDSTSLIHLGDLRLTLALAGAVTTWMVAARAYSTAVWWSVAVAAAFGTVAVSKIVYLGWGVESTLLDFKAASGHAAGATAVLPIVLYLAAGFHGRSLQMPSVLAGWLISGAVAFLLVLHHEHTTSEALAGWCIGACTSVATWIRLRRNHIRLSIRSMSTALIVMVVIATGLQTIPIGWWLVRTALILSGAPQLHHWDDA